MCDKRLLMESEYLLSLVEASSIVYVNVGFSVLIVPLTLEAALPSLFSMINNQVSRSEDNIMATENAISAIGKLCQFCSQIVDVNQILPLWVEALPIESDSEEAPHVYGFFMELLEGLVLRLLSL